jgi:ABC-type branched-subunit amino acid transport system substrate-binding protein
VLVLLVSAGLAACGSSSKTTTRAATTPATSAPAGGTTTAAGTSGTPLIFYLVSAKIPGLDLLDPYNQGGQLAVQKINAAGGFGGHPIVLKTCNSMLQPANAITCAHDIVQDHATAMWGCEPSWSASGALTILQKAGIPSFNCPNTVEDFHNPTAFSIFPGGTAEYSSGAKFICTLPNVKSVYWIAQANPEQEHDIPIALTKIFSGCGKTIKFEWFPFTAVDVTPYAAKVTQSKPDFIMQNVTGAAGVSLLKAYQTQGYPASQIWSSSDAADTQNFLTPAGSAANGILMTSEMKLWTQTDDPTVAAYVAASTNIPNPKAFEPMWGWIQMYWFDTAAQKIGFSSFNSSALIHYMSTASDVNIGGSRSLQNPGPAPAPQLKQPYAQLVRYNAGQFIVQTSGTQDGWINGF